MFTSVIQNNIMGFPVVGVDVGVDFALGTYPYNTYY